MKVLQVLIILFSVFNTAQAKEVHFNLPPDAWSLRTGKALDSRYNCNVPKIVDDTEFPGDCPDTSMNGESEYE